MRIKKRYIGLLMSGILLCAMSTRPTLEKFTINGYAQGTTYSITYYATEHLLSKSEIDNLLAVIDSSMSLYQPYSLISRVNASNGGIFQVDEHFGNVVRKSFEIYRESDGLFDITVGPLVQLWGFGVSKIDHFPDSSEVNAARDCVGMEKIRLSGTSLEIIHPCTKLDLNGIAQGYSVDIMAALLESKGIDHYLVELGGELRIGGAKPDGLPMRIGIERPINLGGKPSVLHEIVAVTNGALTTAGNYRKFLVDGEQEISHHIDPRTGYPFRTGTISATVYASDAMTADGYDNVFIAMHATEAITLANRLANVEVYLIYRDDRGAIRDTMSQGFEQLVVKKNAN